MRILADTHVLLWWLADDPALPVPIRQAVGNAGNQVFASAVSIAEISIKASLGKLEAPDGIAEALTSGGFDPLPFTADHAEALRDLPWHHRDPFDRMLLAQARCDGLVLATADARMREYHVPLL